MKLLFQSANMNSIDDCLLFFNCLLRWKFGVLFHINRSVVF